MFFLFYLFYCEAGNFLTLPMLLFIALDVIKRSHALKKNSKKLLGVHSQLLGVHSHSQYFCFVNFFSRWK